ncbi:MAG: hypothetical protein ACKVX9_00395 [Blastocatellia bacterium]
MIIMKSSAHRPSQHSILTSVIRESAACFLTTDRKGSNRNETIFSIYSLYGASEMATADAMDRIGAGISFVNSWGCNFVPSIAETWARLKVRRLDYYNRQEFDVNNYPLYSCKSGHLSDTASLFKISANDSGVTI